MNKVNNFIVQRPSPVQGGQTKPSGIAPSSGLNFQDVLNQKIKEGTPLKLSKHAEIRMQQRNINLTGEQMDKVNAAVSKADEKGVKESLVLVDDIALVVSVKNRTIITVADSKELKENVFTNIDGAVII